MFSKSGSALNIFLTAVFLLGIGCGDTTFPETVIDPPGFIRPYFEHSRREACGILQFLDCRDPSQILLTGGIRHPEYGSTFFADIDHERNIVKLKSVRDRQDAFLLFDPDRQGSRSAETGSRYLQARCVCGGNRFILAAGICFPEGRPEDYSRFVLAGKCTSCGMIRILFSHEIISDP
ncbi:hypothetical protein JXA40_11275 [bacterium]|nr:hypothetical protein [candidate division CSSED10-310 bacterium]